MFIDNILHTLNSGYLDWRRPYLLSDCLWWPEGSMGALLSEHLGHMCAWLISSLSVCGGWPVAWAHRWPSCLGACSNRAVCSLCGSRSYVCVLAKHTSGLALLRALLTAGRVTLHNPVCRTAA